MTTETISIHLNGKPHTVPAGSSIAQLVADLGRNPSLVAVEHNSEIVPRGRYAETKLAEGDRLEVVQFVQGGAAGA